MTSDTPSPSSGAAETRKRGQPPVDSAGYSPLFRVGRWRSRAVRVFGTALGTGYVPWAPGTWGTLPAVAMFLAVVWLCPRSWQTPVLGGLLALSSAAAIPLGNWAYGVWGRKDPRCFVLDEVAGFLLTVLLFRPAELMGRPGGLLPLTLWAFVVTRAMDIVKIPPARQMESLSGGWGILLDDLMASLYAAGLLHLLYWAWPAAFGWG
jgi:phosphatidylglycerophosphatase A